MNEKRKTAVIFLDVDETIVDSSGLVPPSTAQAIRRAQENGHICVLNTGRPFSHLVDSVRALGIKGCICSCGQHISVDGHIIQNEELSPGVCAKLLDLAAECRVDLFIEGETGLFHSFVHPMSERMLAEFERFRKRGFKVDIPEDRSGFYFSKFCAWENPDCDMERFLAGAAPYVHSVRKQGRMYEMVKNGCSKAIGIEKFLAYCGLEDAETYAVGDSGNDAEMLQAVKHGIAMGNAQPSLKELAEYVTADFYDGGLMKAFEHYGLI